jgi:hypothetical protein
MPSQSDPLAEPTVGVPAQSPAEAAPQNEAAPQYETAPEYEAAPQYEGAPQEQSQYATPQYAQSYEHNPYGQQPGPPYGSQYDAPPGYPTQPAGPRRPRPDRRTLVAACLAFLVVVLGAPALVVAWRSAVDTVMIPSGLVTGVLVVTGLAVLAAGVFPLVTAREPQSDAGPASLFRAPVVLALVGAILLLGAAITV